MPLRVLQNGTYCSREVALTVLKPERINTNILKDFVPSAVWFAGMCIISLLLFEPISEMLLIKLRNVHSIAAYVNLVQSCY